MTDFYGSDLAAAHASGFSDLSLAGGRLVLDVLHESGLTRGTIVDLGCGSGEWVRLAASHGFDAVGVDVSPHMTGRAAGASSATFVTASLWDFDIVGPAVAVTAFGEALTYGTPRLPTAADLLALFRRVSRALVPGGLLAFDVIMPGEPMRYRRWTDLADHTILVDVEEDPATATVTRSIVVFARDGEAYHRSDERHIVRIYDQADIEQALASAGLSWTTMQAYGETALGPRRLAYIARRT